MLWVRGGERQLAAGGARGELLGRKVRNRDEEGREFKSREVVCLSFLICNMGIIIVRTYENFNITTCGPKFGFLQLEL